MSDPIIQEIFWYKCGTMVTSPCEKTKRIFPLDPIELKSIGPRQRCGTTWRSGECWLSTPIQQDVAGTNPAHCSADSWGKVVDIEDVYSTICLGMILKRLGCPGVPRRRSWPHIRSTPGPPLVGLRAVLARPPRSPRSPRSGRSPEPRAVRERLASEAVGAGMKMCGGALEMVRAEEGWGERMVGW